MSTMEADGPSPRPHLELVSEQSDAQEAVLEASEVAKWQPVIDAYAQYLEKAQPGEDDYFYNLVASYVTSRVGSRSPGAYGTGQVSPLIEALSASPSPAVKNTAMEFIHVAAQESPDAAFRVAKNLVDDPERAKDLLVFIEDLEESEFSVRALKKTWDAITTHWWERVQGYREQINELRQDQVHDQQERHTAQNPAA